MSVLTYKHLWLNDYIVSTIETPCIDNSDRGLQSSFPLQYQKWTRCYKLHFILYSLKRTTRQVLLPALKEETCPVQMLSLLKHFYIQKQIDFMQRKCREAKTDKTRGRDKRANVAALRQAKIYPPQQAAAAGDHGLRQPGWVDFSLPQSTSCRNP